MQWPDRLEHKWVEQHTRTMKLFGKLVGFGLIVLSAAVIWQSRNTVNIEGRLAHV